MFGVTGSDALCYINTVCQNRSLECFVAYGMKMQKSDDEKNKESRHFQLEVLELVLVFAALLCLALCLSDLNHLHNNVEAAAKRP